MLGSIFQCKSSKPHEQPKQQWSWKIDVALALENSNFVLENWYWCICNFLLSPTSINTWPWHTIGLRQNYLFLVISSSGKSLVVPGERSWATPFCFFGLKCSTFGWRRTTKTPNGSNKAAAKDSLGTLLNFLVLKWPHQIFFTFRWLL